MENEQINLTNEHLQHLPLFFRKILFNELTDSKEEDKLLSYNRDVQAVQMQVLSSRPISKTIDLANFITDSDEHK